MSEGLQIQRYGLDAYDAVEKVDDGPYVLFTDAERLHDIAQEQIGKNLILTVEKDELLKAIKIFLQDADKTPPWTSTGAVWVDMLMKLNQTYSILKE